MNRSAAYHQRRRDDAGTAQANVFTLARRGKRRCGTGRHPIAEDRRVADARLA
jgi:hypothetical protein